MDDLIKTLERMKEEVQLLKKEIEELKALKKGTT